MILLLVLLLTFAPFPDATQRYYASRDVEGLQALCAGVTDVEDDLLCRYRLYPLTEDEQYLSDLPASLDGGTARAQALLSGLWGYKAARAPFHKVPRYGMRAEHLIQQARAQAPDDPFVLLIDGQSLLFKPALVGGDAREALRRFERLHTITARRPDCGVAVVEADLWRWYALDKLDDAGAEPLRRRLLASNPPRLYREFLESPL